MIIQQDVQLPNGKFLLNLDIVIGEKHFHRHTIATPNRVSTWFTNTVKKWIAEELISFCNQREHALVDYGMYNQVHESCISKIRLVANNNGSVIPFYTRILEIQEQLNILIPSPGSPHHSWKFIINEIIRYTYDFIHPEEAERFEVLPGSRINKTQSHYSKLPRVC